VAAENNGGEKLNISNESVIIGGETKQWQQISIKSWRKYQYQNSIGGNGVIMKNNIEIMAASA